VAQSIKLLMIKGKNEFLRFFSKIFLAKNRIFVSHFFGEISFFDFFSKLVFSCSTDINIFAHPHYDTYHDIARVHWHAFKVPDNSQLSIRCDIQICTDIPDASGKTSCEAIPTVFTCSR
jgi:hypothetical protein